MGKKSSRRAHKPQKHLPSRSKAVPPAEQTSNTGKPGRSRVRRVLSYRVTFLDRLFGRNVDDWAVWLTLLTTGLLCAGLLTGEQWFFVVGLTYGAKKATSSEQ